MSFLIFCIFPSIISYIYVLLYCVLRKINRRDHVRKVILCKIGFCICFNYLLMIVIAQTPKISCTYQLMLLEILSGIDIHIRKIPTELLVALGIVSVVTQNISVYSVLFAVPTGFVFYFFRKRIGIGLYDILLIVLLGTTLQNPLIQLKFIAVILILWGMTGSILGALKNRKDLSIPLVPLITFSYYAVQTIL